MHDWPTPAQMLSTVARALRGDVPPSPFECRVAAAALDIARRQIEQDPEIAAAAQDRLVEILGQAGGDLERRLAERIRAGEIGEATPGLIDHLWQVTLAKVAVDQPGFPLYRRLVNEEETG